MISVFIPARSAARRRRITPLVAATLGAVVICPAATLPVIQWQIVESHLTLHEPVVIRVSAENTGDESVVIEFGANFKEGLQIRIIDPNGKTIAVPAYQPMGLSRVGTVQLRSKGRYVRDFVVNDWYEFASSGQYSIGVLLRHPIRVGAESLPPPPEFFASLVIDSRDEAALRKKCEALLSILMNPSIRFEDTEAVLVAANELGLVRDPIAVEYLVRATNAPVDIANGRAVRALAELGTEEALLALNAISQKPGYLADEARLHLGRIQELNRDPVLRERLRAAKQAAEADSQK